MGSFKKLTFIAEIFLFYIILIVFFSLPVFLLQLHGSVEAGAGAERLHRVSVWRTSATRLLQQGPLSSVSPK